MLLFEKPRILPHALGSVTSYFGVAVWASAPRGTSVPSQGVSAMAESATAITVSTAFTYASIFIRPPRAASGAAGQVERGQQQGVRAVLDVVHGRELFLTVAAAVARGHEHHAGRADGGHVLRVVPRPGGDAAVARSARARRPLHGVDDGTVERRVGHAPVVLEVVPYALALAGLAHHIIDHGTGAVDRLRFGIADVDAHPYAAGNRVDDVGRHVQGADRCHRVTAEPPGDRPHAADDGGGGDERIVADPHGRRAGVVLHPVNGQPRPGDGDDAL